MNSNGQSFVGVQPDGGSFSQPNAFVLNEGVQHSAAMLRIFQNHDFARDAKYIARLAAGQNSLAPGSSDKRRNQHPVVTETLLKKLVWWNTPNWKMEKINNPLAFTPDGARKTTRRELAAPDKRQIWGGPFTYNQLDTSMRALEKLKIIERTKDYDPLKETSKITVKVMPYAILDVLAAKKEVMLVGKGKKSLKRRVINVAEDVMFLAPGVDWKAAIRTGERVRAASAEYFYEPELAKFLVPLAAHVRGFRRHVQWWEDRRSITRDDTLISFLTMLIRKYAVNPENLEFRRHPISFTKDSWRALSIGELLAEGFSAAQIKRCRSLLVKAGLLEWGNLPKRAESNPRIYARLRLDLILDWMRKFARKDRFPRLPKDNNSGWVMAAIQPEYSNISSVIPAQLKSENLAVTRKDKVFSATSAENKFVYFKNKQDSRPGTTQLSSYSARFRAVLIKSPETSGSYAFQEFTARFVSMFPEYFAEVQDTGGAPWPGHQLKRLNHKLVARLRSWFHRGSFKNKMTLKDLNKWWDIRNRSDRTSLGANGWKLFQNPEGPEKMFNLLDNWPGIKAEIDAFSRTDEFNRVSSWDLEHWNDDVLEPSPLNLDGSVDLEKKNYCLERIDYIKAKLQLDPHHFEFWEDRRLPMLIAMHELGLWKERDEFIRDCRDDFMIGPQEYVGLMSCTRKYRHLAFAIEKHYPDLIQALNLPPAFWTELRKRDRDDFNRAQVLLGQQRLCKNEIDEFNAPWLVDPDTA